MPTQERQISAIGQINEMDSALKAYNTSRADDDIQALLLAMYRKCDCHMRDKESLLRRMRNQELYKEFLESKEHKNKDEEEIDKDIRRKSEKKKLGVYGYHSPPREEEGGGEIWRRR